MKKLGLVLALFSLPLWSYEFQARDWQLKAVVGADVRSIKYEQITKETPGAGAVLGLDLDYMFEKSLSALGTVHSVFLPGAFDLQFGGGAKYRLPVQTSPFIPYVSGQLYFGFLIPSMPGRSMHFNVGPKVSGGFDYFVLRNLAVGLDVSLFPSFMKTSGAKSFEMAFDIVLGVSWRI